MAYIRKMRNKWQAIVRKKNYPHVCRSFFEKSTASKWAKDVETPMVKKKIKKTLVVEKPKPTKPKPIPYDWHFCDWWDLLDEDAPPPPEDIEKVLNIKKREVVGLESLLRLHKFVG